MSMWTGREAGPTERLLTITSSERPAFAILITESFVKGSWAHAKEKQKIALATYENIWVVMRSISVELVNG